MIQVFGHARCQYCKLLIEMLDRHRYVYVYRNILTDPAAMADLKNRMTGPLTVPQVFIGGKHVGGYAEMVAAIADNTLQQMIGESQR